MLGVQFNRNREFAGDVLALCAPKNLGFSIKYSLPAYFLPPTFVTRQLLIYLKHSNQIRNPSVFNELLETTDYQEFRDDTYRGFRKTVMVDSFQNPKDWLKAVGRPSDLSQENVDLNLKTIAIFIYETFIDRQNLYQKASKFYSFCTEKFDFLDVSPSKNFPLTSVFRNAHQRRIRQRDCNTKAYK
eukprot:TRINITY_DN3827_c0_g1_i6.p1 TRINITY_DN3827_c0_g1~~TRINITY_DN3827_c0_g1_i6.p1  ORF type:complete len:186 (+),score=14.70 TRINITY_DN3827_c0_g1_i6:249-806(+)